MDDVDDAPALLLRSQARILRYICSISHRRHSGLQAAARGLKLAAPLQKQLTRLDIACALVRHATAPGMRELEHAVVEAMAGWCGASPAARTPNLADRQESYIGNNGDEGIDDQGCGARIEGIGVARANIGTPSTDVGTKDTDDEGTEAHSVEGTRIGEDTHGGEGMKGGIGEGSSRTGADTIGEGGVGDIIDSNGEYSVGTGGHEDGLRIGRTSLDFTGLGSSGNKDAGQDGYNEDQDQGETMARYSRQLKLESESIKHNGRLIAAFSEQALEFEKSRGDG